uniref:Uncharacterized protein n=1 Tax=Ditylum brightwellii TaxID=49249 RepID=A0A7S4QML0_9STRA
MGDDSNVCGTGHPGCKGDPRMNRAVHIRTENPRISLLDALIAGGFTFPASKIKRQSKKEGKIYDSDGVSLNQRRNQLSKRLWQVKRRGRVQEQVVRNKDIITGVDLDDSTEVGCVSGIRICPIQNDSFSINEIQKQPSIISSKSDKPQVNAVKEGTDMRQGKEVLKISYQQLLDQAVSKPNIFLASDTTRDDIVMHHITRHVAAHKPILPLWGQFGNLLANPYLPESILMQPHLLHTGFSNREPLHLPTTSQCNTSSHGSSLGTLHGTIFTALPLFPRAFPN